MAPMRRKSHGSIRSPHVKRDSQSQVVIEGWLYKLEGGALKQFKHRWCVLADFCLFFYKGPSEDKVTSSILLPSYKISPCTSDDKISRKFAFKAEHQNMKTYYFAADDLDSMKRWMNAISLASIMQKFVRSENFDATFSSVSNDDEDSGFKSYRSRRYTSQKLNTVHDSHFGTEPLKQRSNSYGDRMGEVYLGSDDKYPDAYKNSHLYKTVSLQDEAPRRQPLYANAPPKPKRLTHSSDNYATYQGEYDPQDYKSSTHDPNMYYYEKTSEGVHSDYHRAMGYVPSHQSRSYDVGSDPAIMDSTPLQYIDNYSKNIQAETAPDLYRSHPPRPRSADFLERDAECEVMPDVAHYTGNNQPQRPKSSLEYYNHYVDSDDGNFDDYREAVRIQADNLYLNKNLNKPHKHPSAKQQTEIDQRLNIHYVGNSGYLTNESVSPCYASTSKSNLLEKGYSINDNLPIYQKEDFNSADKNSKPSKPQESLQRLLEWKQRMLQSPLTKRNHLNSNSSNSSSSMTSPMKSHRTDNYHRKTSRTTETLEAQVHMSNSSNYGNYIHPSNLSHFPQSDTYPKYEESYESQHSYNDSIYGTKKNKINSEAFDHTLPKNVSGSAEKLYKENMLYCVDSENNEILFSYNDNSPNEDEVTSNLQTCHYPPQMHSFSTLPNVSSIGNENQDSSLYDEQCMVEHSKSKYSHTQYKPDFQEPKSTETTLKMTNYSSDDEDDMEKLDRSLCPQGSKEIEPHTLAEGEPQPDRYLSSSPDYVNIGAIYSDPHVGFIHETATPNDSFEISRAVLKPLEQVSKSNKALTVSANDSVAVVINAEVTENTSACKENSIGEQWVDDNNTHNQTFTSTTSRDTYDSDLECDIKREDYYRASQIFYASTRAKAKQIGSKMQESSKIRKNSGNTSQRSSGYVNVSVGSNEGCDKFSNLDKDIGIPLPTTASLQRKEPDVIESSKQTHQSKIAKKEKSNKEPQITPEREILQKPKLVSEDLVGERSLEIEFSTIDDQRKDSFSKSDTNRKLSYEEMRGQLLRKREAPPPNIVQDRIKKFETVDNRQKNAEKNLSYESVSQSLPISDSRKERITGRSVGKRNRHKANRQKSTRRILYSDSEAMALGDTDESSDDLTMKSAPILLSPLSSVLADLRRTAEAGKENLKLLSKEINSVNSAIKEPFHAVKESDSQKKLNFDQFINCPVENPYETTNISVYKNPCKLNSLVINDEVEYLPMDGLKSPNNTNICDNEPEYVSMNGYKLSSSKEKLQRALIEEEHVYNEPFSPPPSFLHDVYEKQKTKHMQYMKSSSSEDSLTENIYEKPFHRFPSGSVRSLRNEYSLTSVQETNSILMSSLSCSNVTSVGRSSEVNKMSTCSLLDRNNISGPSSHHYEQPTLSVSVPDLLQLQEMKDSDASDADDEASRDFDSVVGTRLPSYQSSILNQFSNNTEIRNFPKTDCNSSFDSEIAAANLEDLQNSNRSFATHHYESPSSFLYSSKPVVSEVKPLTTYQTFCSVPESRDITSASESSIYGSKTDPNEDEKKYQVQKLRVYTKGKKPEAPKIFPVPFNLEESEICKILERKDSSKTRNSPDVNPTFPQNTVSVELPIDNESLSENVAYLSRSEVNTSNTVNLNQTVPSYRPDVVPELQVDNKVPNDKVSPSKSPNSAPYYYSDLCFANGVAYLPSHLPFTKRSDITAHNKTSPPKNSSSLLNNELLASPSCKGDIGKKVNKINYHFMSANSKDSVNEKALIKYWKGDGTKSNLRCNLDIFQSSKSKYLDAEKNKYEAGNTLEKTRSSNPMSYFKHRASTPELSACQYQSNEPVYENLVFQPKLKLQKRLSHSLEGLSNATIITEAEKSEVSDEHVYENIEFFILEGQTSHGSLVPAPTLAQPDEDKKSSRIAQISSQDTSSFPERQFCSPVSKTSEVIDKINSRVGEGSSEAGFLDKDILRRVSEQCFFSKNTKPQPFPPTEYSLNCNTDDPQQCDSLIKINKNDIFDYKNVKSCNVNPTHETLARDCYGMLKDKDPDSGSTSCATSSYDEASADSDNQHHGYDSKIRTSDMIQSVSAENYKKEPTHIRKLVQQSEGLMCKGKRLSVSAGDLLGKTHEELVLLLIQLRRNQSKIMRSREKLENQIENINQPAFHNGKDIQRQIQLLEKQYEVTQPLVTLVDNMVKLGSLYGSSNRRSFSLPLLDTSQEDISPPIQSNTLPHHIGESSILSQLLAEESNLQKRISEIYSLDKGLRLETNSISSLHQDKEMLECTLSGMRNKILDHQDRPSELQKLKKQQKMIEKELIRVKRLLSTSAKKIEDAASKNDQMEKDILYLRQILTEALKTGSTETKSQRSRADIEAELCRVQNVLDELANHRQEINNTVEKLKSESHPTITSSDVRASPITVTEEKDESGLRKVRKGVEVRASPTGVAGSAPLPVRKKQHSTYLETDLDTMHIRDLAIIHEKDLDDIPVYANAEEINHTSEDSNKGYETPEDTNVYENCILDTSGPDQCSMQDINEADERMKRFYGIIPKEKPSEIKTVRIVKRQSERRNRERDKKRVTYDDQSSVWVLEDLDLSSDDHLDMDEGKVTAQTAVRPSSINLITSNSSRSSNSQSAHERLFGTAAKNEQDKGSASSNHDRAYPIKRSKRRHYTVSGYQYMLDPQFSQYFTDRPRSRDDVDMERCLRTANTPDIVRSTIKKNEVFDDKMIERELMLPQKIEIPERYVEVEPEQLSAIEKLRRSQKAENICKMLSETTTAYGDVVEERSKSPEALHKKLSEEKKKRAHLLNLNRAIAREVVEKSKAVAALATLEHMMRKPLTPVEEDISPMTPLPITQQRYNFLT